MIEWTIFYKLLDIPGEVTEPTYYHLLDIDPKACTKQTVTRALQERKKRLRQSIPGPHFIALVLKFEREQLERAAEVLGNSKKRRAYNKQLIQRAKQGKNDWIKAERARVIKIGRERVLAALNEDGTIEENKRPGLAQELSKLGFSEGDIRVLFEKIPVPLTPEASSCDQEMEYFVNAVSLAINRGILDGADEHRLIALAGHLSIPAESAKQAIAKQLARTADQAQEVDNGKLKESSNKEGQAVLSEIRREDREEFFLPDRAAARQNIKQPAELSRRSKAQKFLPRLLSVAIPLIVIGSFAFLLWWSNRSPIREQVRKTPALMPTQQQPTSVLPSQPPEEKAPITRPAETSSRPNPAVTQGQDYLNWPEMKTAALIRCSYSTTQREEEILADIALTMLGCCVEAERFVLGQSSRADNLKALLAIEDRNRRTEALIKDVEAPVRPARASIITAKIDPQWLEGLKKMLRADNPQALRYRAIEELRINNSAQAAQILLDALQGENYDQATVGRILRALRVMGDPRISLHLVDILEKPRQLSVVNPIVQTLIEVNGLQNEIPESCPGVLPLVSTGQRRKECVRWWRDYYNLGYAPSSSSSWANIGLKFSAVPSAAVANSTEMKMLRLISATADYSTTIAEYLMKLDGNDGAEDISESGRADTHTESFFSNTAQKGAGTKLLDSLDAVADECLRLVRLHPNGQAYALQIDDIELRRKNLVLLYDGVVEKIAVTLEATGELLEIMLKESDPDGQYTQIPDALQQERRLRRAAPPDLAAARQSCYYNLVLWSLLVYQTRG